MLASKWAAGDCTRSYSPSKLAYFTRQIVFIRPGTFVIFDRVCSKDAKFKKTWLLQAMNAPTRSDEHLVVTNGKGRLFVQTLLPQDPAVKLVTGPDLYRYDGRSYPPDRETGPAPQCRVEISPAQQRATDYFLHILTATDANTSSIEEAMIEAQDPDIKLAIGNVRIIFTKAQVGGKIEISSHQKRFTNRIESSSLFLP